MIQETQDPTTGTLYQQAPPYAQTLQPSAGYTTTFTSSDLANRGFRGIAVVLDVTNANSGTLTVEIDGKDPASGKYYALLTGGAVSSNGTNLYRVYPGLTAVANATASDVLPSLFRVKVTQSGGTTVTYSLGILLLK